MRNSSILFFLAALSLTLAACSKSETGSSNNSSAPAAPTQLNWDQGNWNQTNWQ